MSRDFEQHAYSVGLLLALLGTTAEAKDEV
jgi:hypothetical protein